MNINDYTYDLPQEKIAIYPLPKRDASKLLIYKDRQISHSTFVSLADYLPDSAFLFFNNTKVIPARLLFKKETGASIEIFLLNPLLPSVLLTETMRTTQNCTWHCTIGNLKKWPAGIPLEKKINNAVLFASLVDRKHGLVEFRWNTHQSFAEVIGEAGATPLPPYINRNPERSDRERYQTIYSKFDGAVAAPTAGLHFTGEVFDHLKKKNIGRDFLTLHVSAGTFQPIKSEEPDQHVMHEEQIIITRSNVENLLIPGRFITAVGTTSLRTLESLYWFGTKLLHDPQSEFNIGQNDPYITPRPPAGAEAIRAVMTYMQKHQLETLTGETSIFIRPGYSFKICKALITNFHQPASTLILLVAAFVGEDWKKIYREALENDYRFLSYGDSSLLIP